MNGFNKKLFSFRHKEERFKVSFCLTFRSKTFKIPMNPQRILECWNFEVIFDKNFTFRSHISAVRSSCFYHMRNLQRIRSHLDLKRAKLLATALVSSLDYCNSLLYGITDIDHTAAVYSESTGPSVDKVPSIYLQCSIHSFLHSIHSTNLAVAPLSLASPGILAV